VALKQILDSLEGLDQSLHSAYAQGDDGKFYLDAEGLSEMRDALKKANKEAADRRKELERLKDINPDEYKRLKQLEEDGARKDEETAQIKEQMAANHKKETEKLQAGFKARETKLLSALEQHLVDAQVNEAINAEEGSVKLLAPSVKGRLKFIEDESGFKVNVLTPDGKVDVDGEGKPRSIRELVKSMKAEPDYMPAFKGNGASGGGAPQGHTPSGGAAPTTSTELIKAGLVKAGFSK
jgi:Skp family chaperone for outer membrane proteins